ncbi:MAG TPA: isocitrate lyase/phosphoenolpyruvate mutase family protein, partial [Thermoleophilaceae bacterium]|nr:isocitrate lyase/phosphoenolpyruvate mutase family protein [Thermoleophilaceae bacterium]
MTALADQAGRLRDMHRPGDPVVLPNAWDPPSARRLAATGAAALATTSVGVAEALGYEDGERTPSAEMLAAVGRIAAAVDVPVTADLEAGYGLAPEELVAGLLEAGAVGLNQEDTDHTTGRLADPDAHAERLAAIKEAGRSAGVDVVLNARVDSFLRAAPDADPDAVVDDAVARGRRYAEAGADCAYPIAARGRAAIRRLVEEIGTPVNIVAVPGGLGRSELAALGVARVSFGGGLAQLALEAAAAEVEDFV